MEEVKRNEAKSYPSQRECCLAFRRCFYLPKYKNDSVKRGGSISVLSERDEQHRDEIRKEKRNLKKRKTSAKRFGVNILSSVCTSVAINPNL
jgi:hypothetical protein